MALSVLAAAARSENWSTETKDEACEQQTQGQGGEVAQAVFHFDPRSSSLGVLDLCAKCSQVLGAHTEHDISGSHLSVRN